MTNHTCINDPFPTGRPLIGRSVSASLAIRASICKLRRARANGLPAVNVARPTMWGNYAAVRIGILSGPLAVDAFRTWVDQEASWTWTGRAQIDLRGHNLACWCAPDAPCHADVLLELARRSSKNLLNLKV